MRRIFISCLLFILACSATQAQLLWRITGKGLKHPSYLFATHHYIPIEYLDSVPGLYKAFNECETVVGEVALSRIDAIDRLQNAASMPNHGRISDLLKNERYAIVDSSLRKVMKLGLKDFAMMNPSLILSLYKMELYKKSTKQTDDTQSDSYFQLIAEQKDKKVMGLETVEQQIDALFGNGTLQRQADILYQNVVLKNEVLDKISKSVKLYKAGKINEVYYLSKGFGLASDYSEAEFSKLVDERNEKWMQKLPGYIKNSSCFITVDAIHLPGNTGLIKLLEKAGYHVSAVK